jgi:hypothetical protein
MAELIAERLGRLLLPFPHSTSVDDDVVFVRATLDLNGTELK